MNGGEWFEDIHRDNNDCLEELVKKTELIIDLEKEIE